MPCCSVFAPLSPSAGYPSGSLWSGSLIERRAATAWGDMSLVEATRSLLLEAFRDPLNQR